MWEVRLKKDLNVYHAVLSVNNVCIQYMKERVAKNIEDIILWKRNSCLLTRDSLQLSDSKVYQIGEVNESKWSWLARGLGPPTQQRPHQGGKTWVSRRSHFVRKMGFYGRAAILPQRWSIEWSLEEIIFRFRLINPICYTMSPTTAPVSCVSAHACCASRNTAE